MSIHADCAKAIRKELKEVFPLIKFSVTSSSFAGGDSVRVRWNNGPTYDQVNAIVKKYQYGHFDGMIDCYENSNSRNDIPQSKYVQCDREVTDDIKDQVFQYLKRTHNGFENVKTINDLVPSSGFYAYASEYVYRILYKLDLTNGFKEKQECQYA